MDGESAASAAKGKGKQSIESVPDWTYGDRAFSHSRTSFSIDLALALEASGCKSVESVVSRFHGMKEGVDDVRGKFWTPIDDREKAFNKDGNLYGGGDGESRLDTAVPLGVSTDCRHACP